MCTCEHTHTHTPGQYLAAKVLSSWNHSISGSSFLSNKTFFSLYTLASKAKHRQQSAATSSWRALDSGDSAVAPLLQWELHPDPFTISVPLQFCSYHSLLPNSSAALQAWGLNPCREDKECGLQGAPVSGIWLSSTSLQACRANWSV